MQLISLRLENFRCYENAIIEDIPSLLFLVGDNDVGKTVILDAIELLLLGKPFVERDYRVCNETVASSLTVSARFKLQESDNVDSKYLTGINVDELEFTVSARMTDGARSYSVVGKGYSEAWMDSLGLAASQGGIGAEEEKNRLKAFGETDVSNHERRRSAIKRLVDSGKVKIVSRQLSVQYKEIFPFLPQLERTNAEDFKHPAAIILGGLKVVARQTTSPLDVASGKPNLDLRLKEVQSEIENSLHAHVHEVEERLKKLIPDLHSVKIHPDVTFDNVVTGVRVLIDRGEGQREVDEFGQGTNRRVWLGLQEWQREIDRTAGITNRIYLFDEPDTALHYGSQQRIYEMLHERAGSRDTQCIVCTHSIHLIDKAPTSSICLIEGSGSSNRTVRRIRNTTVDADVRDFMGDIGRSLGLTNTALLYEKAFLLVEGESESDALPIYYRTLYGRSMFEDGIHIVNLHTCGAWKTVLEVLFANRKPFVHLLLDADCQLPGSGAKLTSQRVSDAGGPGFLRDQVTFIGIKEFEDAWNTDPILRVFDFHYPRNDDQPWLATHIEQYRSQDKPSDELKSLIVKHSKPTVRQSATKPEIARRIAENSMKSEIPTAVISAFEAVRRCAGY
jgi:putative ATP-dependent endonuclease of the OLD family